MMQPSKYNDSFLGFGSLHSQLDEMLNNFFKAVPAPSQNLPATNVYTEDDKKLVAEVEAPGFGKEDVEVNVHNGILEIKGQKHEKEEDNKKRSYMVRESSASFYRSIALPKYADADSVEASFEDGLLKVTVPFKELPAPKKVAIQSRAKNK